jgi:hypothetical protein
VSPAWTEGVAPGSLNPQGEGGSDSGALETAVHPRPAEIFGHG